MNKINVLPDAVKKMIAAGEVVEGPYSVVKELLENSIDAHATSIDLEIADSGLKKILVRDNGDGIYKDDLPLSVMEHATSKIRDINDILQISSYGFRGEALSSISAISKVTILTRNADEETGARLESREGKVEMGDYAGAPGTAVIVENLFYNTPARKKFLKSKSAELKNIKNVFLKTAIANPDIRFTLSSEEKRVITLNSVLKIEDRIADIYGREALQGLYFERVQDIKVTVEGFLSKPEFLKSSRSMQILYVNNRPVEYRNLGFLLSRAYEAIAGPGRYPAAIIFITIDPQLLDVNIHPAKREVKFFDQRYIEGLISGLCKKALNEKVHRINEKFFKNETNKSGTYGIDGNAAGYRPELTAINDAIDSDKTDSLQRQIPVWHNQTENYNQDFPGRGMRMVLNESAALYKEISGNDDIRIMGVVFESYIFFEKDHTLYFIDFHAAHERMIYDALMASDAKHETQELMFPLELELSIEDHHAAGEGREFLLKIGFDIDDFSDRSILVRGIPIVAASINIEELFKDIVESLKTEKEDGIEIDKRIAERIACHAAKRAGDKLSTIEIKSIIADALSGNRELRCPHGRPYMYKLEKKDLERIFKRA